MEDPVREGVRESIEVAHNAGIHVKMITGDYRKTAARIAHSIGIIEEGQEVLDGSELEAMDDAALAQRAQRVAVFSRIRPHDKLRIVRALQSKGEIVAMIGDGVNDAPALKKSNIGVVVGSATDVAKEHADLVLLDNNFRTIVAAIEEGRTIFQKYSEGGCLYPLPIPLRRCLRFWCHDARLACAARSGTDPLDSPYLRWAFGYRAWFEPKEDGTWRKKPLSHQRARFSIR